MTERGGQLVRSILASGRKYNLHSHTQFCDGRADMETMVKAAMANGFTHWGFSPHSPLCVPSTCNMSSCDVSPYIAEVYRLRQEYEGDVNLYASMEIDYVEKEWGPSIAYFSDMPLDYRIGSVHFIPTRRGEIIDVDGSPERFCKNVHELFSDDIRYVVETFYSHTAEMIIAGGFDIIGHFDKIGYNASVYSSGIEDEGWYDSLVCGIIDMIAVNGLVAELNTKAFVLKGRFFPLPRYVDMLVERSVPIAVNSDAHYPERVADGRSEAYNLIDSKICQ